MRFSLVMALSFALVGCGDASKSNTHVASAASAVPSSAPAKKYSPLVNCLETTPNPGSTYQILVRVTEGTTDSKTLDAKLIMAKPNQPMDLTLIDGLTLELSHKLPLDLSTTAEMTIREGNEKAVLTIDFTTVVTENGQAGSKGVFKASDSEFAANLICRRVI